MYKDGHTFSLHVLEPMDPQEEAELSALLRGPPEKPDAESTTEQTDTDAADKQSEPSMTGQQKIYVRFNVIGKY